MIEGIFYVYLIGVIGGGLKCFIANRNIRTSVLLCIWCVLFPFGGPLIICYFSYVKKSRVIGANHSSWLEHVGESDADLFHLSAIEEDTQIIPLSDALDLADTHVKRERFMEALNHNIGDVGLYIKRALNNEDSETTHYAASLLQGAKAKMSGDLDEFRTAYNERLMTRSELGNYCDLLDEYLRSGLCETMGLNELHEEITKVTKKLVDMGSVEEVYLIRLIKSNLSLGKIEEAHKCGRLYINRYPDSIDKYLTLMSIGYSDRDNDFIDECLNTLRSTNLTFDAKTMNQIRFWMGVEA